NMIDELEEKGMQIDFNKLEAYLQTKVYKTNARTGKGIDELIKGLDQKVGHYFGNYQIPNAYQAAMDEARALFPLATEYLTWQYLAQEHIGNLPKETQDKLASIRNRYGLNAHDLQKQESLTRHDKTSGDLDSFILKTENHKLDSTNK